MGSAHGRETPGLAARDAVEGPHPVGAGGPMPPGFYPIQKRVCACCGASMEGRQASAKYCRKQCSKTARRRLKTGSLRRTVVGPRPCVECGNEHQRHGLADRCADCALAWRSTGRHKARWGREGTGGPRGTPSRYTARHVFDSPPPAVASTRGAANELIVAVDLMRRGYHVYRALSPAAPCDLLVQHGEIIVRVEVRSTSSGKPAGAILAKDKGRFDVAAVVAADGTIHYDGLPTAQ
jgi:hypothetical protein